jgi:hypothetical protein
MLVSATQPPREFTMKASWILVALALAAPVPQEKPAAKLPQKGDTIVVKGCLKGTALESTETGILNAESTLMTALVYRLTGDKEMLKKLRKEHDSEMVEVTGTLKSTLPPANEVYGKTFGKSRITIGVGSPHMGSPASAEANRSVPVLEVKSYEGRAVKCTSG